MTVQAPLLEVTYLLQASKTSTARPTATSHSDADAKTAEGVATPVDSGVGGASAVLDSSFDLGMFSARTPTSDAASPQVSSGSHTPALHDALAQEGASSWLVRMCVRNISPQLLEKKEAVASSRRVLRYRSGGCIVRTCY